jgi:hypothetical protein
VPRSSEDPISLTRLGKRASWLTLQQLIVSNLSGRHHFIIDGFIRPALPDFEFLTVTVYIVPDESNYVLTSPKIK